jgi:hypothetical protein
VRDPRHLYAVGTILPRQPPDPAVSTAGDILLLNGQTMTGYWRFWINDALIDFVASDGKRWLIPLDSVLAAAPTPTAGGLGAQQIGQAEADHAGGQAQPGLRQEAGDPSVGGRGLRGG